MMESQRNCQLCEEPKDKCVCREVRKVQVAQRRIVDAIRQLEYQREVYDTLKEHMERKKVWDKVCDKIGFDSDHSGINIC